ncbi:MAG: hypothetical protein E7525_04400 [Ruminococcaceae bacterium]|nr:hypothetical protein [Oscillospiraceae bacterium]
MTLTELSNQYLATAKALTKRSKSLGMLVDSLPPNQRIIMKRRINLLCYDAAECRRCAKILNLHCTKENDL